MKIWFKKILKNIRAYKKPFFKVIKNGNNLSFYDRKTTNYLESELPNPTQKALYTLIKNSVQLIISKREIEKKSNKIIPIEISRITDFKKIEEAILKLKILDESKGHLMCIGDFLFDFSDRDGNVTQLEYLGFGHLRIENIFKNDAELQQPLEFLNWLDIIGISEPLNTWIEDEKRRKENERKFLEWKSVAPNSILKHINSINENPFEELDNRIMIELKSEIPNEQELVLRLFKLFGTGFGPWNGFPSYESIPLDILMKMNIGILNEAFENEKIDEEEKEGMARFLSSWDFAKKRKSDIKKVKNEVKDKLLYHLEKLGNKRKIQLFKTRVKK